MIRVVCLLATLLAGSSSFAQEEVLKGDWRLLCDGSNCVISAQTSLGDTVFLARPGHVFSAFSFGFRLVSATPDPDTAIALQVNGGPKLSFHPGRDFGNFGSQSDTYLTEYELAGRILRDMRNGSILRLFGSDHGEALQIAFSLDGLKEALKRVADIQNRDEDDLRIASPNLQPHNNGARPPVDGGSGPRGLPATVVDRHYRESDCEDLESGNIASVAAITARLSAIETLYALPCTKSSSGITWRLYRTETGEIGGVATLYFARHDARSGWTGTDLLWNIEVHEQTGRLTALRKGKGETDCGYFARWIWRDRVFALDEVRQRANCSGSGNSANWPVVYNREN